MIILEENFMSKQLRVYREGAKTEFDYQILWEEDFTKLADITVTAHWVKRVTGNRANSDSQWGWLYICLDF